VIKTINRSTAFSGSDVIISNTDLFSNTKTSGVQTNAARPFVPGLSH